MSGGTRIVRVVHAQRDRHGRLWLRVELADGSTVEVEPAMVSDDLKREFVGRVRQATAGRTGGQDLGGLFDFVDQMQGAGREQLQEVIDSLNRIAVRSLATKKTAEALNLHDVVASCIGRRSLIAQVNDVIYWVIDTYLGGREGRGQEGVELGALTGIGAVTVVVTVLGSIGIMSYTGLLMWRDKLDAEDKRDARRVELARENPEDFGRLVQPVDEPGFWDKAMDIAGKVGLLVGAGLAVKYGAPAVVRAVRGR